MMILDDFKVLVKGAIGSLTFGAYHMYITTIMIYENNRNNQLRIDEYNRNNQLRIDEYNRNNQLRIDGYNRINQLRFDELYIKIEKLEKLSN
jgi:hypothetical protein